ncbi:hypothetical protein [Bartonella henselae]|uniref:hypothetical protein n=1 Tax=Bartonella henselae TaxID=38323 RepID=UPI001FD9B6B8|nr:hypothetical protein [Bartonella henselae]
MSIFSWCRNYTARQQLAMHAEVHWLANDLQLLKYFQSIEKSAKTVPQLEVEVSLSALWRY